MEVDEIEAVLEKIWDLHDKLSDAILSVSRTHFLSSVKSIRQSPDKSKSDGKMGFVFVKGFRVEEDDADDSAVREAKSLNAIRTALENLEDQLEFFHTVQTQQRAERDAAIARLEQSRIVLAMRLAEHQGSKYKVIDEARAFVGNVRNATHFIQQNCNNDTAVSQNKNNPNIFFKFLISGYNLAKQTLKLDHMGGVLGHAGLVAASMVALLHLHQVTCTNKFVLDRNLMEEDSGKTLIGAGRGSSSGTKRGIHLDVLLARG
jgi:hypothetical protein